MEPEIKIGTQVRKHFEGYGLFKGRIVAQVGPFYRVLFEDGDDEDMEIEDIKKCLWKEDDSEAPEDDNNEPNPIPSPASSVPPPPVLPAPQRLTHLPGIDLEGNYIVEIRSAGRLGIFLKFEKVKDEILNMAVDDKEVSYEHPDVLEARERGLLDPGDMLVSVNGVQHPSAIISALKDSSVMPKILSFMRPSYKPKPFLKVHKDAETLDVCAICFEGGNLVCCDVCPRSFHCKCLKVEEERIPDKWQCHACDAEAREFFRGNLWESSPKATPRSGAERVLAFHKWVMQKDLSLDFNAPVEWKKYGLLDYPEKVKQPLDFGTIQLMAEEETFSDEAKEGVLFYVQCMRLVFFNCSVYNEPHTAIARSAEVLSLLFERYYLVHLRPVMSTKARQAGLFSALMLKKTQDVDGFMKYPQLVSRPEPLPANSEVQPLLVSLKMPNLTRKVPAAEFKDRAKSPQRPTQAFIKASMKQKPSKSAKKKLINGPSKKSKSEEPKTNSEPPKPQATKKRARSSLDQLKKAEISRKRGRPSNDNNDTKRKKTDDKNKDRGKETPAPPPDKAKSEANKRQSSSRSSPAKTPPPPVAKEKQRPAASKSEPKPKKASPADTNGPEGKKQETPPARAQPARAGKPSPSSNGPGKAKGEKKQALKKIDAKKSEPNKTGPVPSKAATQEKEKKSATSPAVVSEADKKNLLKLLESSASPGRKRPSAPSSPEPSKPKKKRVSFASNLEESLKPAGEGPKSSSAKKKTPSPPKRVSPRETPKRESSKQETAKGKTPTPPTRINPSRGASKKEQEPSEKPGGKGSKTKDKDKDSGSKNKDKDKDSKDKGKSKKATPNPKISFGTTKIYKEFPPEGIFEGTILKWVSPYYKVRYEDGDEEELEEKEILPLLDKPKGYKKLTKASPKKTQPQKKTPKKKR